MAMTSGMWSYLGSASASLVVISAIFQQCFPHHFQGNIKKYAKKFLSFLHPYTQITFEEFSGKYMKSSEAFSRIRTYLKDKPSASAKRLKADNVKDSHSVVLSMDYTEDVTDEFQGVTVWKLITESYISHVLEEGKAIGARNRQQKLYANNPSDNWYGYKRSKWNEVVFDHPATFDTLAMDTRLKEKIRNDFIKFSKGKEYYKQGLGRHGSVAISLMDNTELKRLLIDTSNKSIIVIEDIDCSLDLTGKRKKEREKEKQRRNGSTCGEERIIVSTTNHKEKLDRALIRGRRMDQHIEMSYCCFEAFKVLAKNHLCIDSHPLFGEIGKLLEKTNMIPADVAENMMPKSEEDDVDTCLKNLIKAFMDAKEKAKKKAEEEVRTKERTNLLKKMFKKMKPQPK
ncbi:hypothetical protein SLEP1_g20246 [Rubroshorea leprosula]|uniref:Uncharacterized protein n=1 Tax=Rubroshorea leprosula TaxID=152421 RepID=A0AAV5JAV8_9ROSI|nr:hypothetical protein SLEP1_g20246 [Rubroshorea leprosula]